MEKDNTLDFELGSSPLSLDNIWADAPDDFFEESDEKSKTKTEPSEDPKPIKLDSIEELEFEEDEEEEEEEEVEEKEVSTEKQTKKQKESDLLAGVRSVLLKKMERYEIDTEEYDIANMTEEELVEFEESLDSHILSLKYDSIKRADPNLQKVLDFIENGGDPRAITKLFKEQESIMNIDASTEEGKIKKISSYYKDVLGWSEDKVAKKLDRLKMSELIDDEYEDIEGEYDRYFEERQEELLEIQRREAQVKKQREEARRSAFSEKLAELKIPNAKKAELLNTAFNQGIIKGTDQKISILDYKIAQMQADPEKFLRLVQFVNDPESYNQMILKEKENKIVEQGMAKGFKEVSSTSSKPVKTVEKSSSTTKSRKFNFSNIL